MLNKGIEDLAWRCLPREFREEVKKMRYSAHYTNEQKFMIRLLFGDDNLTSDAEGEEMLTVSRKKVLEIYQYNEDILSLDPTHSGAILLKSTFQELFGSKCLPDTVDILADNVDSLEQKIADLNTDRPTCTDVCSSQIDERRLNIAATIAAGMAVDWYHEPQGGSMNSKCRRLAEVSIMITDALIAECKTTDK